MRLFLAVDLDAAFRDALGALVRQLEPSLCGWRWVRSEVIHLTVRFLGEVPAERDAELRGSWDRAVAPVPAFVLRLGGLGCFPPRGAPRVLWVEALETGGGKALASLAEAVESEARRAGFEAERRPFRPHLTLARARRGARPTRPVDLALDPDGEMRVESLTLFRSELNPSGARYTALESFPLTGLAEGSC